MTALAEALLAAQRQAIGALAKPYVAGTIDAEDVDEHLLAIGCTDTTDRLQLFAAWDVLKEYGAPAPKPAQSEPQGPKPQTPGQRKYVMDLYRKQNIDPLPDIDLDALNFDRTSELIDALKSGSYDPENFSVPF